MARVSKMTQSLMRGLCKSSAWSQSSMRGLATAAAPLWRGIPQGMTELAWSTAAPITQAKALHPRFYIDDEYVAAEREAIFGGQWFAAAHTSELATAGDVKVIDVGGTSIILTRDKAGKLNAFYNVCRHRGAKVCQTSQKACKQLVCPYHWWAYRLDGSLKSTPPAATPKERKETLGLQRVPGVEVFAGMVFLNQRPNPPPLSDFLGDLPEKLIRYDLDDLELSHQQDYNIKGDWKLIAENFVDFYHINAVHPELSKFSRVDDHLPYQGRGQYIGFVTAPLSDSGGPGDSYHFNPFPRLKATETSAALFFQIFPNVSVTIYPHSVYTLMTFPTNTPGVTQERLSLLMGPTARKTEDDDDTYRTKCKKLMDFVVNINDEDVDAIENLQLGLSNARQLNIQGEFVPKYDWPVHRFQNMILGGLKASSFDETLAPKLCNKFEEQVMASL
mmetsp:Transcript_120100/g.187566  ORF Transcript_120100/g.187566 Transcript_120100/m.187566 type:complete len:446 (+) Transcript_120100:59-1396(+)